MASGQAVGDGEATDTQSGWDCTVLEQRDEPCSPLPASPALQWAGFMTPSKFLWPNNLSLAGLHSP